MKRWGRRPLPSLCPWKRRGGCSDCRFGEKTLSMLSSPCLCPCRRGILKNFLFTVPRAHLGRFHSVGGSCTLLRSKFFMEGSIMWSHSPSREIFDLYLYFPINFTQIGVVSLLSPPPLTIIIITTVLSAVQTGPDICKVKNEGGNISLIWDKLNLFLLLWIILTLCGMIQARLGD